MKINKTPFEVSIPSNFDPDSIIPVVLKTNKQAKYRDAICYFLNLLFPKPLDFKKRKQLQEEGYISLRAELLKKIIGPEYNDIISWSQKAEVIKVKNQYIVGKKNRGYRIERKYFIETKTVSITDRGICKRYWKNKKEEKAKQIAALNKVPYLTKWLNDEFIKVDINGAHTFIETYRFLMLKNWEETTFPSKAKKNEARYRILNRCFYQRNVVSKIHRGEFNNSIDASGRLYTPFVHLKKELRSFVTLGGKKIGSVDIKSSQPYLFQTLLDKKFWMTIESDEIKLWKIHRERYKQLNKGRNRQAIIMILKNLVTPYGIELQDMPIKKINWENDFYEHIRVSILESTDDAKIKKLFRSRAQVKKTVMLLLYDKYETKKTPYYLEFKKHFPDEVKIMDTIKFKQPKNVFPTILQAVEAKLMLEKCSKKISEIYPELPILTIHDSIVCDVSHLENVKQILENVLMENVGNKPGLKIELMEKEVVMNDIQQTVDEDWQEILSDLKKKKNDPDWVASFNEDPKEIPLRRTFIKDNGKIQLDIRMMNPEFDYENNYNDDDLDQDDYGINDD